MAQVGTQQTETHNVFLIPPHQYIYVCLYVCVIANAVCRPEPHDPFARVALI